MAKFHEEMMIFDEIRGHLQGSGQSFEGALRKRAIKIEGKVLDTPNFHRTIVDQVIVLGAQVGTLNI